VKTIDAAKKSLLPQGLRDVLPDVAYHEAAVMDGLLSSFRAYGYARVQPPMVEFEENLLDGPGEAMIPHTFRLMDPVSQKMMGVRADMTPQVARIAATRLESEARPLRLSYGGQVLRVKGTQLRPERQFAQAGAELIGATSAGGDAEVIAMAANALLALGVENLSVDISLPTVVRAIVSDLKLDENQAVEVRQALDRKDASAIAAMGGDIAEHFGALLRASGRAEKAILALDSITLPAEAQAERDRLIAVLEMLKVSAPDVMVTLDAVEHRGFEYQTGLSFTLFAEGVRGELGRGGRYISAGSGEEATGVSLYLDSVLRAVPAAISINKLFLPFGTTSEKAVLERAAGWITVAGLEFIEDVQSEARRLGCTHILLQDGISAVA